MKKNIWLVLLISVYAHNAFNQTTRVSRNRYVPVVENYLPAFDDKSEYDEFLYWDGEKYRTVGGNFLIVHYNALTGKDISASRIHKFYEKEILKKLNPVILYAGKLNPNDPDDNMYQSVYRFDIGTRQVWVQILSLNNGKEYEIVEIEGRERETNLTVTDMKTRLDSLGAVDVYINFDINRYNIRPESEAVIMEVAKLMIEFPDLNLLIEGHTDNTGLRERNIQLSKSRAEAVKKAITNFNIDESRLTAMGFGPDKPIADNSTEAGRSKNRRVVLVRQ
jgi:outer membrane protein OmpA-like peptidoglycan-associated protein